MIRNYEPNPKQAKTSIDMYYIGLIKQTHLARQEWEHACRLEHYSPIKIVRQVPEIIRVPVDRQTNSTLIIKP